MIAQHREVHTVFGSILSKHKTGYRNHPVVKLYLDAHLHCLVSYHAYTVEEMERRGWHGHKTPVSDELLHLSRARRSLSETCADWDDHVYEVVPAEGPNSLNADMHDLIDRWTNENKLLRNDLSAMFVEKHAINCQDACCVTYATSLVAEFHDRVGKHMLGDIKLKGHASLKGRLELLVAHGGLNAQLV